MRFFPPLLRRCLIAAWGLAAALPLPAARVALVIPDNPDLEAALTAALSKAPEIEIVERSALPSLAREATLAGAPLKIEGADSVVLAEKQPDGAVTARISDARTGAVLQITTSPPGLDSALAAAWLGLRLRPWSAPATVERKFSLLGLRFETDSHVNRQTERSLNLALAAALQAAPGTVVLERWKLHDLLFEKEVLGAGDEPFWKGAILLDGSIAEKSGMLTVRMRLRSAGQESLHVIESASDDLPALATRLGTLLSDRENPAEPTRTEETSAYKDEARWLLHHGLKKEAAQAAETVIALGDASQDAEVLRIRAYAEAAYPENLDPKVIQGWNSPFEDSDVPREKISQSVLMATSASTLSAAYARKYAAMKRAKNVLYEHPTVLCVRTLPFALSVLRSAHKWGFATENPSAVEELRSAIKDHITAVQALPLAHARPWLDARAAFFRHLIFFAPFWNETPAETLHFMERVLSLDFEQECPDGATVARRILRTSGFSPPAIPTPVTTSRNWTGQPKVEAPRLINWRNLADDGLATIWREYVEKKLRSPDVLEQADGLAFLWTSQASYSERNSLGPQFVDFFEKNADAFHGIRGAAIWGQILHPVTQECQWIGQNENRLRTLAVFEKLLTGSLPLPPGMVGSTAICTPQEAGNRVKPEEGQRLLDALSQYANTHSATASEKALSEIRSARNAVLRRFPNLAPRPPEGALPVTRAWIASRHTPEALPKRGPFEPESGTWHEGRLWFLDADNRKIWKVDPRTLETEVLAPEHWPEASEQDGRNFSGNNYDRRQRRLVFLAGKLYLAEQNGVWVFDPRNAAWNALPLPKALYSLWLAGGRLFAGFGETSYLPRSSAGEGSGLFEIDPATDAPHLIFNSRRRPAQHPLDAIAAQRPGCVLPGLDKKILVGLLKPKGFYALEDGAETPLIAVRNLSNLVSRDGDGLFCHTRYDSSLTLHGIQRVDRNGILETLLWNPASDVAKPAEPVWKFPESLPDPARIPARIEYRAALHGENLILLVYQYGNTSWGAGLSELFLFRRGQPGAQKIPLTFRLSGSDDTHLKNHHFGSETFAYPMIDHYGLIPTDHGLAITGRAMPGFWFVPWSDLEAYEKKTP